MPTEQIQFTFSEQKVAGHQTIVQADPKQLPGSSHSGMLASVKDESTLNVSDVTL